MKKLTLLIVSILFGTIIVFGQGQTPENLLKSAAKSDADIADPKKNIKSGTWEDRGDLFLEMAQFNTKGLYQGMPQQGITGAEMLVGKAKDIKTKDNTEDWIYDRVTLHFVDKVLDSWEETKPLDPDALNKAFQAYIKASELDIKGKFKTKNNVKINIATLRGLFTTAGVECYSKKEYKKAVENLDKALSLYEWPKLDSDTIFKVGLVTYYTGMFAFAGNDFSAAEKYYLKCIENKWEDGTPYSALSAVYKETKQKDKELAILQKGFELYPGSKDLLIGFINYYLNSGQSDKALEKLEIAIKDDPKNPTFIFAKATLFDNMVKDSTGRFTAEQKKNFLNKAIEGYKYALELKADYFDANYNLGALYFNEAVYKYKEADAIPFKEKDKFEAKVAEAKVELEKALPFMEKAHQLDPMDRTTIETLIAIYHRLQKYDKKKEMLEKKDKLPVKPEGGL